MEEMNCPHAVTRQNFQCMDWDTNIAAKPLTYNFSYLQGFVGRVCDPSLNLNKDFYVLASELWFLVVSLGSCDLGTTAGGRTQWAVIHKLVAGDRAK